MSELLIPTGRIAVRMVCQGLGDCFLVAIRKANGIDYTAVDCGVIAGSPDGPKRAAEAARLLREGSGGRLDRLILTHQHYDHVSSFADAPEEWERFEKIAELWFAWTEDPRDPLAVKLAAQRKRTEDAVAMAMGRISGEARQRMAALMGFAGEDDATASLGFAAKGGPRVSRTQTAMETAVRIVTKLGGRVVYRTPGEVVPIAEGVQFVTLGPPRDERKIKRSDPSRANPEVYTLGALSVALKGFEDALGDDRDDLSMPFEGGAGIPLEEFLNGKFDDRPALEEHKRFYLMEENAWRRIDEDWLGVAESLALNLDSDTNNTSLAFALYEPTSDAAWLFPADAQVGNWLSWGDQTYSVQREGTSRELTAEDLLARTVFYKVGHHGSHNATLRAQGLELMTHQDLCAMVPVDVAVAHGIKRWTKMPFLPMMARLRELTRERVVQLDALEVPPPFVAGPPNAVFGRAAYIDLNPTPPPVLP